MGEWRRGDNDWLTDLVGKQVKLLMTMQLVDDDARKWVRQNRVVQGEVLVDDLELPGDGDTDAEAFREEHGHDPSVPCGAAQVCEAILLDRAVKNFRMKRVIDSGSARTEDVRVKGDLL